MQKFYTVILFSYALVLISGCESTRKAFSGEKSAPDEFAVFSRPPLTLPPNYKLRPPKPGANIKRANSTTIAAKRAILNQTIKMQPQKPIIKGSPGMMALLRNTGGLNASADIRATINTETSILSNQDKDFVDKLIFWVDEGESGSTVVDPKKEQKRIQNAKALGKPITEGKTPDVIIQRRRKGFLDF
jgi:hypothetical protein